MQDGRISVPIIDGHVNLIDKMAGYRSDKSFGQLTEGPVTLSKLRKGNVRVIVTSLHCRDFYNGPATASAYLETLLRRADTSLTGLRLVKTVQALTSCYQTGSEIGTLFTIENADALIDTGTDILKERAIKVVGLTHSGRNRIGDGYGVKNPIGLTDKGKSLIKELEGEGFAIDVAHLSEICFWELANFFQGPLICSHAGFRFFSSHPRDLTQEQLDFLFARNAIVGISANPDMFSPNFSSGIEEMFKSIDWVVQKYGAERVALGSNFCGFTGTTRGLEDISKLSGLIRVFMEKGYPADAIIKIMGANWYRFYSSLLAEKEQ